MSDGIVCFAGQDWYIHGRAHCDFQVMRELAGDDRVLVVNSIGMRVPIPGRTEAPARRIVRKLRSILRHYLAGAIASSTTGRTTTPRSPTSTTS